MGEISKEKMTRLRERASEVAAMAEEMRKQEESERKARIERDRVAGIADAEEWVDSEAEYDDLLDRFSGPISDYHIVQKDRVPHLRDTPYMRFCTGHERGGDYADAYFRRCNEALNEAERFASNESAEPGEGSNGSDRVTK